jgi:hypothetical protein
MLNIHKATTFERYQFFTSGGFTCIGLKSSLVAGSHEAIPKGNLYAQTGQRDAPAKKILEHVFADLDHWSYVLKSMVGDWHNACTGTKKTRRSEGTYEKAGE